MHIKCKHFVAVLVQGSSGNDKMILSFVERLVCYLFAQTQFIAMYQAVIETELTWQQAKRYKSFMI